MLLLAKVSRLAAPSDAVRRAVVVGRQGDLIIR
jgi:hypothetical protein